MHYPVNVFTGKVREYEGSRPSAIAKVQVDGELTLTDLGLAGDQQAEKKIHGGPDRALCHYPREHYQHWNIYRWGDALIQVTQPRSPCFKLNYHFGIQDMSAQLQNAGKTGWLYRVVQAGQVSADAPLELASRLSEVSVYEACAIAWHMPFDDDQYHRLLSAAGLSTSWTRTMQKRRISGKIESSSR